MYSKVLFTHLARVLLAFGFSFVFFATMAQTYGPNDPATGGNNTSIGTNNWSGTNNTFSSDNSRATVATRGMSRYLTATNFNFNIPATQTIDGIEVEIERSSTVPAAPNSVAILDNWTTGLTKTISAGVQDRCLVVIASTENGDGATDVTSMTYGGQSMTQIGEYSVGAGFVNRVEIWILLNAGITAASSTTIVPTISATSFVENTEIYTSAVFQYVDQYNPILDIQSSSLVGTTTPYQLGTAVNTYQRALTVTAIACGNNTTPASAIGGTNTYSIDLGFTEGTDIYFANPSFSTSGGCLQTATLLKTTANAGTIQPTFTFAGTPNRQVAVAFTLQYATGVDNSVRIIKGGTITGSNYAKTNVAWPAGDATTSYGGPTDLWGTTWTPAEINATNFGVALSGIVQGNQLRVDYIRITVYTSVIILPIELAYFKGEVTDKGVELEWQTHTEKNNDYFTLERSSDGIRFESIHEIDGAGNSNIPITYSAIDTDIFSEKTYYRLKQTDFDYAFTYSNIIAVNTSELARELVIFPNPATSYLKILNFGDETLLVRIISQTGVKVLETLFTNDFNKIDVSSIPRGLYMVEIIRGANRRSQKILVSN